MTTSLLPLANCVRNKMTACTSVPGSVRAVGDGMSPSQPPVLQVSLWVYICAVVTDTVTVHEVVHDTVYQVKPVSQPITPHQLAKRSTPSQKTEKQPETEPVGVSMLDDGIRYDLLAENSMR